MRHCRLRERHTELEGDDICGTAGRDEIEGERRDGIAKEFGLRMSLPRFSRTVFRVA